MILRKLIAGPFSEVLPLWKGETVVLIGGGASLTRDQVETVRREHAAGRVRCIAINDAYLWAPWADVLYFADAQWWEWHTAGVPKPALGLTSADVRERFAHFAGQKCSNEKSMRRITDDRVHILRSGGRRGWSWSPTAIRLGGHGGYQALNIGMLAGAARALLLGYDGKAGHWHGSHPRETPASVYPSMRQSFVPVEKAIRKSGVSVLNCSPGSAIETFPRADIATALA